MPSILEEKYTVDKFDKKKEAFFNRFGWDFMPFAQKDPLPDSELLVPHQKGEVQELIDLVKEGDLVSFITSRIGMGKTALSKFLSRALPEEDEDIVTVFLHGPSIETREQMLRLVLENLELHSEKGDVASEFEQLRTWHQNYPDFLLVIIVDEFPDISKNALEIVRSVADLEGIVWIVNGVKNDLMSFVRDNAPALMERKRFVLELDPLELEEARELLLYRMAWAKGGEYEDRSIEPFTDDAIEKIHEKSDGVPRRILKLAGDAVYNAIERDELKITEELVREREEEEKEEGKAFWSFLPFLQD